MNQLRLFKLQYDLLKTSIDLQTALAADTHLAEGQWLKERLNVAKLRMFRVGTRRQTVSRTEGQFIVPQKALIRNNNSILFNSLFINVLNSTANGQLQSQ
jgi:hypothetical protein